MTDASVEAILECKDGSVIAMRVPCDWYEIRLPVKPEFSLASFAQYRFLDRSVLRDRRFKLVVPDPPRVYREV